VKLGTGITHVGKKKKKTSNRWENQIDGHGKTKNEKIAPGERPTWPLTVEKLKKKFRGGPKKRPENEENVGFWGETRRSRECKDVQNGLKDGLPGN